MENTNIDSQKWYHSIAAFFAGIFLANFVPHFVNGISGDPFPSPFSSPPGMGLSSPFINVLWALLNLVIGYVLFRASKISSKTKILLIVFFIGVALMSVNLSMHFEHKQSITDYAAGKVMP